MMNTSPCHEMKTHQVIIEKTVGGKRVIFVFRFAAGDFGEIVRAIEAMQGKYGFDTIDACMALSEATRRLKW